MQYQASSLKDVLFHTRLAMEDSEQYIAVFHDDRCVRAWEDDSEPEPERIPEGIRRNHASHGAYGEGDWYMPRGNYLLRRPGGPMAGHFNSIARLCAGAGS